MQRTFLSAKLPPSLFLNKPWPCKTLGSLGLLRLRHPQGGIDTKSKIHLKTDNTEPGEPNGRI